MKPTDIAQASAAANRIRGMRPRRGLEKKGAVFDLASLDDEEKGPQGVKIELQNVWFQYPTRDVPVLNGLNMTVSLRVTPDISTDHWQIEKGQFAAIVGPSGCGKTSIISLLERYAPNSDFYNHKTRVLTPGPDSIRFKMARSYFMALTSMISLSKTTEAQYLL
jgi:ABC-type multidrug transport system fused ATPase/permease subunit